MPMPNHILRWDAVYAVTSYDVWVRLEGGTKIHFINVVSSECDLLPLSINPTFSESFAGNLVLVSVSAKDANGVQGLDSEELTYYAPFGPVTGLVII